MVREKIKSPVFTIYYRFLFELTMVRDYLLLLFDWNGRGEEHSASSLVHALAI